MRTEDIESGYKSVHELPEGYLMAYLRDVGFPKRSGYIFLFSTDPPFKGLRFHFPRLQIQIALKQFMRPLVVFLNSRQVIARYPSS